MTAVSPRTSPRPGPRRVVLLAAVMLAAACQRRDPRPSVVLITLDTLRADHLGCYGYPRETTPFLDSLAADGVRFDHAVAASSHTGPCHASIFTSLSPIQHRVLHNGHRLGEQFLTLAEVFGNHGYETAAFTSVTFLKSLDHGFQFFSTNPESWKTNTGASTIDRTLQWLDERDAERPLFLWVHLYDAHTPYLSDGTPFHRQLTKAPKQDRAAHLDYLIHELGYPADFGAMDGILKLIDSYDAEVRFADQQVRRLYQGMQELGDYGGALWTILADHGEGLGNHYVLEHDIHVYNEQVRIPFLLHREGGGLTPRVVNQVVHQFDVLPTLADFAGFTLPDSPSRVGQSLWPLVSGEQPFLPDAFAVSVRRPPKEKNLRAVNRTKLKVRWVNENVVAIQSNAFKYIHHSKEPPEFYDLVADPLELHNLSGQGLPQEAELRRVLEEQLRRWQAEGEGITPELDGDGHLEELEALGY